MRFYPIWLITLLMSYITGVLAGITATVSDDDELFETFEIEELETEMTKPCLMVERVGGNAGTNTNAVRKWACILDRKDCNGGKGCILPIVDIRGRLVNETISGPTEMVANGATINIEGIDVSTAEKIEFVKAKGKAKGRLQGPNPMVGKRTVIAVQVKGTDVDYPTTILKMIDNIFNDAVSLRTQMSACSYGELELEPFTGNLNGIKMKFATVQLSLDVHMEGRSAESAESLTTQAMQSVFGKLWLFKVDHAMYFFPKGVEFPNGWAAYAELPGKISCYSHGRVKSNSAMMHEIGHNIGLDHSTEGYEEYGDDSGIMGSSYGADDTRMCFNGAKSWQLGWYSGAYIDILTGQQKEVLLVGTAHYEDRHANMYVVARVPHNGYDYFVALNTAAGINRDTKEGGDKVLVTQLKSAKSKLCAKLGEGGKFTGSFSDQIDYEMTVEVQEMYAVTSIRGESNEILVAKVLIKKDETGPL